MLKLKDTKGSWGTNAIEEWTPEKIKQLKEISNPISRAVYFWINNSLKGYIIEFSITYNQSYSATEREFFQGPRGRYLNALTLWIKMALHDCRTLPMRDIDSHP